MDLDPLRIVLRVVFSYVVMLVLVRLSGKRAVHQGSPFDFTISLVLGDMIDNAIWGEVSVLKFFVAAAVVTAVHTTFDVVRYRGGQRT